MKYLILFALSVVVAAAAADSSASDNLIVFVGERISVDEFKPVVSPDTIMMDGAFKAKYQVKEVVYGSYQSKTIEFEAYDHYGRPPFEKHQNVLLFVSSVEGLLYHEKYQYFPVFKTISGSWAGCGSPYQYEPKVHHKGRKARALDFGPDAFFSTQGLESKQIPFMYPSKYYRIKGDRAYCVKGNPVHELFEVKRDGVLTARGLFGKDI